MGPLFQVTGFSLYSLYCLVGVQAWDAWATCNRAVAVRGSPGRHSNIPLDTISWTNYHFSVVVEETGPHHHRILLQKAGCLQAVRKGRGLCWSLDRQDSQLVSLQMQVVKQQWCLCHCTAMHVALATIKPGDAWRCVRLATSLKQDRNLV